MLQGYGSRLLRVDMLGRQCSPPTFYSLDSRFALGFLRVLLLSLLGSLLIAISPGVRGQTYEEVSSDHKGSYPCAGFTKGSDGAFYGTTAFGGKKGKGTVFKITPEGALTTLASFSGDNGDHPQAELVEGSDGALYGTTAVGGANNAGTVFKVTPEGVLTTLVSFNVENGGFPEAELAEGDDGAFYGTTPFGGASNRGTVFKVTPGGELTVLVSFNGTNGNCPRAGLLKGPDGVFYGTTVAGGISNEGTVFKVTPEGALTTLVSFKGTNGSAPWGTLVKGIDGAFYGTTAFGGAYSDGTVFKVTPAGELTTLASFNGTNGSCPRARLVDGNDGFFYGTTSEGGRDDAGTVFKVTATGALTRVISFNLFYNGGSPLTGLVMGNDGSFYGTASGGGIGGDGTVFKVSPDGKISVLTSFNNDPGSGLVEGSDGAFYGTTFFDGPSDNGAVFKVTRDGKLTTLVSFNNTNGRNPYGGVVEGRDGCFYGTTYQGTHQGGANNFGTVFKVTPEGVLTTLVSFSFTNGGFPRAKLVEGSDGAFYGTTSVGGTGKLGTVFKVTPAGELTTLVSFNGTNGRAPWSWLVKANDGAFYGTTSGGGANDKGTVFRVTPGGELTTLVSFDGGNGNAPWAGLVQGSDGAFYGTTRQGGANDKGTVFRVTAEGKLTTLVSFDGSNGRDPEAGLVEGHDGAFYGATRQGGAQDHGTVFKVTPHGILTTVYSFGDKPVMFGGETAKDPRGTPILGSDGDIYGTAAVSTTWRLVLSAAPSAITSITDAVSVTGATLHANVNPSGAVTTAWFEYGTSTAYGSTTPFQSVGAGNTSLAINQALTLLPHTTYHFRVVAQNAKGTSYGEDRSFTTLNRVPVSTADIVEGSYGRAEAIAVLANDSDADGDALTVLSFTQPSQGEVIRAEGNSNVLVYVPKLGFSGVDTFTYTMSDGYGGLVLGTVEITVGPRPNPLSSMVLSTGTPVPGAGEEGSGVPNGAAWRSFGVPAINDAGHVAVLGSWKSPEGTGSGIFVDEQLVVKTGGPVPGLSSTTFKSFTDPVLNGVGRLAFFATITGPGVWKSNDTVLVTNAFSDELEVVAREGDVAPATGEARYGKFYSVSLQGNSSASAGLLFTASLLNGSGAPKVKPASDLGAWLRTSSPGATLRKVVREGEPGFAEGERIKSFQLLQALSASPAHGRGHNKADEVSFVVTLSSKRQALVRFSADALEAEEFTGELLGEALPEAKWKSFGLPAADSTGALSAVRGTLLNGLGGVTKANATGIFLSSGRGEAHAIVVRVGDGAFGVPGAVFSGFSDPLVSGWNSGVAFLGSIKGQGVRPANDSGVWWQTHSGWNLVARTGTQAAEAPEGALWKSFNSLALPDGERGPLFVATLAKGAGAVNANNDQGLWAVDSVGELRLLVRERDPVEEKTLKSFSALQAVSGSAGVRRSFNDGGQVVYRAYFTDGSQGVVKVQVP